MNFGDALASMRSGYKVMRSGWNGKGMYVFYVPGGTMDHPAVPPATEALPYIAMFTAQGTIVPWLASQTDMLAEDWAHF